MLSKRPLHHLFKHAALLQREQKCKSEAYERPACRGMPARAAMPLPSPVHVCAEVAEKYALP